MSLVIFYGVLLFVPVVTSALVQKKYARIAGFLLAAVLSSVLMSSAVITTWLVSEWRLEQRIAVLDRDGDGFFSPDEETTWTEEERHSMDVHIGDGGRNVFAAIIFPVFSAAYSFIVVGVYWVVSMFKQRRKNA